MPPETVYLPSVHAGHELMLCVVQQYMDGHESSRMLILGGTPTCFMWQISIVLILCE